MKKQLLLFLFALLPMLAMAQSGWCGEHVTYTYNSTTNKLTIQGQGAMDDYSSYLSVPWYSYRENIKTVIIEEGVTRIGEDAFYHCSGLTSVTIPNSVTSIGQSAFSSCSCLTSITIPNSVTSIEYYAFWGCSGLTSITIPNSVKSIGQEAFKGCSGLTSVTIGNSVTFIGDGAFNGCSGLSSVEFHCAQIGSWFSNVTSIKEVTIGNEVTSIGNSAFYYCSGLTSVTIPNSVTSIGNYAFEGCSDLTSITIPNSVTSIGRSAFDSCLGLNKVIVPDIAAWCGISFAEAYSSNPLNYAHHIYSDENTEITDLVIPDGVTSIRSRAFYGCSGLTSVTIPNSVTSIGQEAFSGSPWWTNYSADPANQYGNIIYINDIAYKAVNTSITSCEFKESTISIGGSAFSGCSGLTSITIPNSVTSIGGWAFYNCSGLTSVTIGNSVTSIRSGAFSGCIGLTSVTIPNSVTSIENSAFSGCSGLTSVYSMIENVFTINYNTFDTNTYSNAKLYVPIGKEAAYKGTEAWKQFTNIEEYDFTPKYKLAYMVDGIEYKVYEIAEGAEITPEPAPTKEGYTFSGWSEIPETMPAHDVTVTGSFAVNQYLITYMIGDEVYQKEYVDYGATIVLPNVPEREGYSFAWIDAPEKMPAHDITINGAYTSGMWGVSNDDATTNTYTISGYKTDKPRRGVNIIRMSDGTTRKVVLK